MIEKEWTALDFLRDEILNDSDIPYWCERKFLILIDELESLQGEVVTLREENLRLAKLINLARQHDDA